MTTTHDATFYVQITRKRPAQYRNGKRITASATGITQEKPSKLPKDTIVVKLTVQVPDEAFEPFQPVAVVQVDPNLVQRPIHVITEAIT